MKYQTNKGFKCDVPVCDREAEKVGYCQTHYTAWRRSGGYVPNRAVKPKRKKDDPKPKCSVPVCDRFSRADGYCSAHYKWVYKNAGEVPTHAIRQPQNPTCSVPDCQKPPKGQNLCPTHYSRYFRALKRKSWKKPLTSVTM